MKYNNLLDDVSFTGSKPNSLLLKKSVSNAIDINKIANRISDHNLMGVTLEWKGGHVNLKGPTEAVLGYCIRVGVVQFVVVDKKNETDDNSTLRFLEVYTYDWVHLQTEEIKDFINKALS